MEKPQVFLSYAYEDIETATRLYHDLKSRGVNVWFDKEHLSPGKWKPQVKKEIAKSQFFLICLSQAALKKSDEAPGFVDDEIQFAYEVAASQENDRFSIIPVRLDNFGRGDHRLSMFQLINVNYNSCEHCLIKKSYPLGPSLPDFPAFMITSISSDTNAAC